jgi:uncharacterized protein YciI
MITRIVVFLFALVCGLQMLDAEPDAKHSPTSHANAPAEFDSFIVVLLVRPPDAPEPSESEKEKLQEEHLANIGRLAGEGKIFKAGPFEDYSGRNVRGMFILKTASLEEARSWVSTDPLVKINRLKPEFLKWFVEKGSLK